MSQVEVLFEYWKGIDWFVIGGPADCDEAQTVMNRCYCIGFEPNETYCQYQRDHGFGNVHNFALWNKNEVLPFTCPIGASMQSASVCRPRGAPDVTADYTLKLGTVHGRTLDSLSEEFGPFKNVALWIDIEYAELAALQGADQLLRNGDIKLINLETYAHLNLPAIVNLLVGQYGFKLRKVWNIGTNARRDAQDYIFTRD